MDYRATCEADVIDQVFRCRRERRSLRVHGARHSVAPAIGTGRTDGVELHIDGLTEVRLESARHVSVGAGCSLGGEDPSRGSTRTASSLAGFLVRRGLALPNLAGVAHQTLAGFLATGSAGSGFRFGLHDAVRAIRLVDGRGAVHDIERGDPRFALAGVSMGLLGVVTRVKLEVEEHYDVFGSEVVVPRAEAPFDLRNSGNDGVLGFLDRHDYARILWWPRAPGDRFVLWTARRARAGDYDDRTGPRGALRPNPYEALPRVAGGAQPMQRLGNLALQSLDTITDPRWRAALVSAFVPLARKEFWDRWDRALPMDGGIDDRLLPFEFAELWFPRERAHEALARLDDFFERFGASVSGQFVVELYAGAPSPFAMSPGSDGPSLRINFLYPARRRVPAARAFTPVWDLFEDMAPRLHWGKHLPPAARANRWIARAFPRATEFLDLRRALDPDGIFLSDYFRDRLGIDTNGHASVVSADLDEDSSRIVHEVDRAPIRTTPPTFRWPLIFDFEPVGLEFAHECSRQMHFSVEAHADPGLLFDAFVELGGAAAWLDHFVCRNADPDDPDWIFEEHFRFMRLRGRTLVYDRPWRWVARVESASVPLATRMLESVELVQHPAGHSCLDWRFHFDPHPLTAPVEPWLTGAFQAWLRKSMRQFGRYVERRSGIERFAPSIQRFAPSSRISGIRRFASSPGIPRASGDGTTVRPDGAPHTAYDRGFPDTAPHRDVERILGDPRAPRLVPNGIRRAP